MMDLSIKLFWILILIIINAFFSSAEMAMVSTNKNKLQTLSEKGTDHEKKKAQKLLNILSEPSKFLATIQVGITFAGFLASASAATSLSQRLALFLENLNVPGSSKIALFIITLLISFVTLVLGELVPKRIALNNSQKIALASVKPITIFSKISLPFVKILTFTTNLIVKLLGISSEKIEEKISEEEIRKMIEVGEEYGVLNTTEKEMIDGIFEFDNTLAKEIMTPRTKVFSVDINMSSKKFLDTLIQEQYSRIPVYEDNIDNIIGLFYIKDIITILKEGDISKEQIKKLLRKPYFVPETKNIDDLFREMQSSKNHMSILIDEYGGFSGIVTIEDLIEEIMGNIWDEYDYEENEDILQIDKNTYMLNASISIDDLNEKLHLDLPSDNYDTLAGFIINMTGNIPSEKQKFTINYKNLVFKIEKVSSKRIEKIKLLIN